MEEELILLQVAKVAIFCFSIYLLGNIQKVKQYVDKIFQPNSKQQNTLLIISGLYISVSLVQLLPQSDKLFHRYYQEIYLQNESTTKGSQHPSFPLEYLMPCFSFAIILLFEKVIGYNYDEQQDELLEDIILMYEMKQVEEQRDIENTQDGKQLAPLEECLMQPPESNKTRIKKSSQFQTNNTEEQLHSNFTEFNFICINFSVFLLGFSLGSTSKFDLFIYQQIPFSIYTILSACQLDATLNEEKDLNSDQKSRIYRWYITLISLGLVLGFVVSFYQSLLFVSFLIAFNCGSLLYISTMKIIEKYYDALGNKYLYYLSFTAGYLIVSYLLY